MQSNDNLVIAFVPGTSASELNLGDGATERAWPEALELVHMLHKDDPRCVAVATAEHLPVGDLVDHFTIGPERMKCYASLIDYMQTHMGFTSAISSSCRPLKSKTKPLAAPLPKVFYHCPYDWRQDNRTSARKLGEALAELDGVYTKAGQTYQLYIVGHSMGGLVSRCLLEDPASKAAPWFAKARGLITLATPHYGAPLALSAVLGQQITKLELMAYVSYIQSVVDNPAFPSTYELLPPPGHAFIEDTSGKPIDLYAAPSDVTAALVQLGFSPDSLQEAKTFFASLAVTSPDDTPIPYHCFVGTGNPTLTNDADASRLAFTYRPDSAAPSTDPFVASPDVPLGDGVVPEDSARFVFALTDSQCQAFPGYKHGQMGGSDMDNAPDAIQAMLALIGLPVPHAGRHAS